MTGAEFRQTRKRLQLSQKGAAEQFGVSADTVQRWEEADSVPKLAELALQYIALGAQTPEATPVMKRPIGALRAKYRDKTYLTVAETAEYLGISRRTIVDWQQRGKLSQPSTGQVHDGTQWRSVSIYPRAVLDELIAKTERIDSDGRIAATGGDESSRG